MSKHTEGSWSFEPADGSICGAIVAKNAFVCDFVDDPKLEDALLMAAAPDLLAALELLLGDSAVEGCDEYRKEKAHAAISKARGKV